MRKKYHVYPIIALATCSISSLIAEEVVNFNAISVQKPVYVGRVLPFLEHVPMLSSNTSEGYSGAPVFAAFQSNSKSLLAVGSTNDCGLKIRWNANEGSQGDTASGLFLFKKADFANGYNQEPVNMAADHDVVGVRFGYMNPGRVGPDMPIAKASFRLVIKDSSGFHISGPRPVKSEGRIKLNAMQQGYASYNPYANDGLEVGTIGSESKPTFQNIEYLGFRLHGKRGTELAAGSNIGVVEFSVKAK